MRSVKSLQYVGVGAAAVAAFLMGRLTNPPKVKAQSALSHVVHVLAPGDGSVSVDSYDKAVALSCYEHDCYVLVTQK